MGGGRRLGGSALVLGILAGLAALTLSAGVTALGAGPAFKGDYGPLKPDGDYPAAEKFWSRIGKDGMTTWRKAAEQALRERGFAEGQITKLVRLHLLPKSKDLDGDYTPGKAGIVKISSDTLPMRFNTETGQAMPFDPVAFAKALPDCYAQDERTCSFKYSGQEWDVDDTMKPCLIPHRTVLFCQKNGFVDKNRFHGVNGYGQAKGYAPSCGEEARGNGCGADEVVFDDGSEQTKLAFAVEKAGSEAASASSAPASTPAASTPAASTAPSAPASAPRIVYHADRNAAFKRREGPKELEDWEYDVKDYVAFQKKMEKASNSDSLTPEKKRRFGKALAYCWPHDVYHPCDLE